MMCAKRVVMSKGKKELWFDANNDLPVPFLSFLSRLQFRFRYRHMADGSAEGVRRRDVSWRLTDVKLSTLPQSSGVVGAVSAGVQPPKLMSNCT